MAELAGPLRVMKIGIQAAMVAYPEYEQESGTKWPETHLDPTEAQLFAFAALRAWIERVLTSSQRKIGRCPPDLEARSAPPMCTPARGHDREDRQETPAAPTPCAFSRRHSARARAAVAMREILLRVVQASDRGVRHS